MTRALREQTGMKETCIWPAAWRSTASPTAGAARRGLSSISGYNRPPAMPVARFGAALAAQHLTLDPAARTQRRPRQYAAPASARSSPRRTSNSAWLPQAPFSRCWTRPVDRYHCRAARQRTRGRLVPGSHGIWSARTRRPLDPRRPALATDAVIGAQPQDLVSRIVRPFAPSVLREHVADWFELEDDSPLC